MKSVKERELPALDDDFAQTASEFDTLDELRADVRTRVEGMKGVQQGVQARDRVLEALLAKVEIPLPEGVSRPRSTRATTAWPTSSRPPA